ncbi:MAG: lytic transglycosylase domain-containing protein [Labilithrix sp.]|nr:lytic transglycosylase domain-containing protein [Labilithrix sp.]
MESGRPIIAAVGLFFGGLLVGSSPGGSRDGTAHAASTPPTPPAEATSPKRDRGPIAPALRKTSAMSRRDATGDVEPPGWSSSQASGASCAIRPKGRGLGHAGVYEDHDDPLAGLKTPELPIPRNPHVLKYIRYFTESHEGRRNFSEALRRSGRFQEIIAKAFRELGLPQDLIAVAFIESGFSTEAVSTAGAAGLWQFMPATGRAYGLSVESTIDERVSIWRSTEAAAHHLSDLYERFRSWELALAAYNLGFDGLDRRLDEYETEDFWTLVDAPGALPKETAHYVPKVLAAAVVFANLDEYGFTDVERAQPLDASELEVPGGTNLSVVARAAGTSLRVLRELNPELLADIVPDRGEAATLHVPRAGLARARTMLPKLASDSDDRTTQVSEDFDWGKDDVRSGRSRLERASTRTREARAPLGPRRTRRRASTEPPKTQAPENREPRTPEKTSIAASSAKAAEREPAAEQGVLGKVDKHDEVDSVETARVLYRVVAGDSVQQIATTVGLTVDQVLAQARVNRAADIRVGTLLDLRVPASGVKDPRAAR